MKKRAIKFFAEYFKCSEYEAKDLNHMAIDCMIKFTNQELERKK